MKLTASAATLAGAAALASSAVRATAMTLTAAADGAVSFTCTNGDVAIIAPAPATVAIPSQAIVATDKLTKLLAGFKPDAEVTIATTDTAAIVTSRRSRSRLATIPAAAVRTVLALTPGLETARAELSGADCVRLLEPVTVAAAEKTRFILAGVLLHSVGDELVAVATDGIRLVRVAVTAGLFSSGRDLILPTEGATILRKLLRATKPDMVTLRRSKRLLAVDAPAFTFTSRLVDSTFPDYAPWTALGSANSVTCARLELLAALERLAAVANTDMPPIVGLSWDSAGRLRVSLAREPDTASDMIDVQASGTARLAVALRRTIDLVEEFDCAELRLEASAQGGLAIVGAEKLALIAHVVWNFQRDEVAA